MNDATPETSLVKAERLSDIDPHAVSFRLVFVKENDADLCWHVIDLSLVRREGKVKKFFALHGKPVSAVVQADSLSQLELARKPNEYMCERCFEELTEAASIIERKKLIRME